MPSAVWGRQSDTDYLAQVNAIVAPQGDLSEVADTLFPLIVAMDRPPRQVNRVRDASLIGPGAQEWEAWTAWAQAQPQQDVLAGLFEVTDPDRRMILGFPYGPSDLPKSWASAGLKVELGRPPVLARAHDKLDYLGRFDDVAKLCTIEATRLASEGEAERCIDVLRGWLGLGRLVVVRAFYLEKLWGMTNMMASLERMRDVAYQHPDLLDAQLIKRITDELDLRTIRPDRYAFPEGERLAAHQLLRLTIQVRGGPDPARFATVMGRLEAGERAFRAFGGAAGWEERALSHASWFETLDEIDKIFGDWNHRWSINDMFHPVMRLPSDYSRMDKARFASVERVVSGLERLFNLRMRLMVAITGTRSALGVAGYMADQGVWPPTLSAAQPRYVLKLDNDPWNYEPTRDIRYIFRFFVPIRDQPRGPRELPKPHVISFAIGSGELGMSGEVVQSSNNDDVFTQFTEDVLRDALVGGIPKGVWDPSTDELDVAGFKTFISGQIRQLAIEQQTMNGLISQIDDYTEAQVRAVIALVEGSTAAPVVRPSVQFSESDWDALIEEIFLSTEDANVDPVAMIKGLNQLWIVNADEMRKRVASGGFDPGGDNIGERTPVILKRLFGIDVISTENKEEFARRMILEIFLSDELGAAIKRMVALEQPTLDDIRRETRVGMEALVDRLLAGLSGVLASGEATVALDNSQFILYSVGPDGKRQMATHVGVGGSDILIWPPLLSLQRR